MYKRQIYKLRVSSNHINLGLPHTMSQHTLSLPASDDIQQSHLSLCPSWKSIPSFSTCTPRRAVNSSPSFFSQCSKFSSVQEHASNKSLQDYTSFSALCPMARLIIFLVTIDVTCYWLQTQSVVDSYQPIKLTKVLLGLLMHNLVQLLPILL